MIKIVTTYHIAMISSRFVMAELLYLIIFVIADIAFSVGQTFSGDLLSGAIITSTKLGIIEAQTEAN